MARFGLVQARRRLIEQQQLWLGDHGSHDLDAFLHAVRQIGDNLARVGTDSRTMERILCGLTGLDIRGMDVVEVSPAYDVGDVTALAGATMALNMLALWAEAAGERASG